uniref:Uncharacterized protein n=1 Tax=Strigamia maritima TaxID=126957 RepID=T1J2Q3_STRMM
MFWSLSVGHDEHRMNTAARSHILESGVSIFFFVFYGARNEIAQFPEDMQKVERGKHPSCLATESNVQIGHGFGISLRAEF